MESIGKKIKHLRESLGLSRDALADKLDITPAQIGMYERDRSIPPIPVLEKLALFLKVPVTYFFTDGSFDHSSNTELQVKIKLLQDELTKSKTELDRTKDTLIRVIQERLGFDKKD